jgi:tetratricopeptide (TPR) repeat protein
VYRVSSIDDDSGEFALEQLSLFEDKYVLLNTGMSELVKLNLEEAKLSLQRYRDIYKDHEAVDRKLDITDFLIQGFDRIPDAGPEEPAYLYDLWISFDQYVKSTGIEGEALIPEIRNSYFGKLVDSIDRCNISDSPYLTDTVPLGYVFLQAGRYDRAIASLQAALLSVPDKAAMYAYLGDAYLLQDEVDIARRCYLEACLIDPGDIDWRNVQDAQLVALRRQMMEASDMNEASATAWLPCHAYLQGLFKPKQIRLKDELKRFVNDYLELRKAYVKDPTPLMKPRLYLRAIVLCDNEAALQVIKGIDFIEIRRHMKGMDEALFARYMKYISKRR